MKATQLVLVIVIIATVSCAKKTTSSTSRTGTTQSGKYTEDLSVLRPKVEEDTARNQVQANESNTKATTYVEPKYAINDTLHSVLDSISRFNHSVGFVDGFTIQVYSGLKREEALNAKKSLSTSLPDIDSELQYVQPNYRVRAGKYYDRFAAQRDYVAIKKHFPNAILLPERLPIR